MDVQSFTLFVLVTCATINYVAGGCILQYNDAFNNASAQPVFMTNKKYLAPNPNTCNVELTTGQQVVVACPGNKNYVKIVNVPKKPRLDESMVMICHNDTTFYNSKGITFALDQISCVKQPDVFIETSTNRCAKHSIGLKYKVGYKVEGAFYALYEVCFDDQLLTTYYVKHVVHPHSCLTQNANSQTFQINSMFKNVPMNKLYTKNTQQERFEQIFGPTQTYIQKATNKHALEKGHLTSRADFTMAAELRATYQYINAVPQWREVNAPRWSNLERALRNYVRDKHISVTVYSGAHGVLSLPKPNSTQNLPIYLYTTPSPKADVVPVPLYLYKVIDEPNKPKIVYVTVNWDSFSSTQLASLRFCSAKCRLNWQNMGDASFCCDYNTFTKHVGYEPI